MRLLNPFTPKFQIEVMKSNHIFLIAGILIFPLLLSAQETQPTTSMAKSLGMYVFPSNNQDAATQQADEAACYSWAVQQSGVDPLNLPEVKPQEVPGGMGAAGAVGGAAKGAAVGAAIGAISGDAGKGAAIGATAGGFGGLRQGRRAQRQGQAQAQQQAVNQEAQMMNEFKKAFAVCLEGKGYTVK